MVEPKNGGYFRPDGARITREYDERGNLVAYADTDDNSTCAPQKPHPRCWVGEGESGFRGVVSARGDGFGGGASTNRWSVASMRCGSAVNCTHLS